MKITVLVENTRSGEMKSLKPENGLSLLIDTNSSRILFDAGASSKILHNAGELGISLQETDLVVISHGHMNNGRGLKEFFQHNTRATVYLKENAFGQYYLKILGFIRKYIGINGSIASLYNKRFAFINEFTEIRDNIFIIPDINVTHNPPSSNKNLYQRKEGSLVHDEFDHELILVIRESDGLVIFTGCSHNGILNLVETVEKYFDGEEIKAVIGGFHLSSEMTKAMAEPSEEVVKIGDYLSENPNIKEVYTGSCTGKKAFKILKDRMGDKLRPLSLGNVIEI